MKNLVKFPRFSRLALATGLAAILLSGCTSIPNTPEEAVYKFTVLRYYEPVQVSHWSIDPAQSDNPEGEALNILTAMQKGDVDQWLSLWETSERPALNAADRAALLAKWQSLKDGQVTILGRVVAGTDLIVELKVSHGSNQSEKVRLPLKHAADQWALISLDEKSEFMNWEFSKNKIINRVDPHNLQLYLAGFKEARR